MNKKVKSILETEIATEPSLAEECQKYGIEYHEPHFQILLGISDYLIVPMYYYLQSDCDRVENLQSIIDEYNKNLMDYVKYYDNMLTPIKAMTSYFKFGKSIRKLNNIEKKEKIECYSLNERDKYIKNYNDEKRKEVEKAKAIVKVAKEEMKLEK